jgi:integrase
MCNSGEMENAEKTYGFYLLKIDSKNYKSGFYYAVKYKDFETKKWLGTKTSTGTDNEIEAKAFAIENRERIIKEYKEHAKKLHAKNDGKEFYKMLEDYYTADSKYLKDDYANNKKIIPKRRQKELTNLIKTYFIPYFKKEKINSIQEITRSVYSNLKIYLQNVKSKRNEKLTTKCISTYLGVFNRILQYHERNEIILKLPYSKGGGMITPHPDDETNSKKPSIIPTDNLKGIFETTIKSTDKRENTLLYYMLALMGLTTGMRDSEIGRIKSTDIIYVKEENYFYLKAYNNKTDYYNVEETDEYRKIPLHPFVVGFLEHYIKEKNISKGDYLFGTPKLNEDTKKMDGYLHQSKTHKAIVFLYRNIKFRENLNDKGEIEIPAIEGLENEMKEKRIVFYSLRHTFNTLCALYRHNNNNTNGNDDLIDYFMGHNSGSKMRANYTHINSVDNKTFYDNYGKFVIGMLNKFIITTKEEKEKEEALENYVGDYVDKKWKENKNLQDADGKIDYEKAVENILTPLLNSLRKKND